MLCFRRAQKRVVANCRVAKEVAGLKKAVCRDDLPTRVFFARGKADCLKQSVKKLSLKPEGRPYRRFFWAGPRGIPGVWQAGKLGGSCVGGHKQVGKYAAVAHTFLGGPKGPQVESGESALSCCTSGDVCA